MLTCRQQHWPEAAARLASSISTHPSTPPSPPHPMQDPANETYRKALEMCDKAPEYYDEIQSQIAQVGG